MLSLPLCKALSQGPERSLRFLVAVCSHEGGHGWRMEPRKAQGCEKDGRGTLGHVPRRSCPRCTPAFSDPKCMRRRLALPGIPFTISVPEKLTTVAQPNTLVSNLNGVCSDRIPPSEDGPGAHLCSACSPRLALHLHIPSPEEEGGPNPQCWPGCFINPAHDRLFFRQRQRCSGL